MGIAKIWDIVWDSEPFHWATAIVLAIAVIFELYTVRQYWSKCGETAAAIKFLKILRNNRNQQPTDAVRLWLSKHLGSDDPTGFRQQHDKFVLIKYPSILARPVPRSSLRFVTTLCTAIGVLGTFYGIQEGLQQINSNAANFEQLKPGIDNLITGMKTAFSTSLMGLGSGSLFTLLLFVCDSLRQTRRDKLRDRLDKIVSLEILDNANSQLSADAIGQAVGRSIAEQFVGLNQLSSQGIGEAVGQQMRSVIIPALRDIFQEQQKIRELQENQRPRVLEELIKDLRVQVIEPISDRLDKSAALTQQASEAVLILHKDLASSIVTIQNFQKETLLSLQNFAESLKQTLGQFQTDTKGVLEQTVQHINQAVDQSIKGMTAQRSAFEESADKAAYTFQGIREELEKALEKRAEVEQQMLQGLGDEIEQIIHKTNTTFQQQTRTLKTVGDQASGLMNEAKENLIATLGNINETLTATRHTVEEDLRTFRGEYQANLQAFFQRQNNLLEGTLGQQRDELAEVVINLDRIFQEEANRRSELATEVDNSMNQIRRAAEEVGQLAIAAGLNSSNQFSLMKEVARDINQQMQGVRQEYQELTTTFTDSLAAWINHFYNSQTKFFSDADNAMARVCGDLLKTAEVLASANNNRDMGNGRNHHE
ncbi:MAG: hypothetical protein ACHBN1_03905 [Heteroscytonema crispum UTEX LB 1556]